MGREVRKEVREGRGRAFTRSWTKPLDGLACFLLNVVSRLELVRGWNRGGERHLTGADTRLLCARVVFGF